MPAINPAPDNKASIAHALGWADSDRDLYAAYEAAVHFYTLQLYKVVRSHGIGKEDAEEIVQDVFFALWIHINDMSAQTRRLFGNHSHSSTWIDPSTILEVWLLAKAKTLRRRPRSNQLSQAQLLPLKQEHAYCDDQLRRRQDVAVLKNHSVYLDALDREGDEAHKRADALLARTLTAKLVERQMRDQSRMLALRIDDAIASLPEPYCTTVQLRYVERLSYSEIATICECSIGTVKSRINRATLLLRKALL